jgi:hypothetical protein
MNIKHEAAVAQSDKVDRVFARYLRMSAYNNEPIMRSKAGKATEVLILCVCSWGSSSFIK